MSIIGNVVGANSTLGKTFVITDDSDNNLITGVITDKEVVFTANPETDIREGKIAATGDGVVTGSKVIPSYHTHHGAKVIPAGSAFTIRLATLDCYDYTNFHGIICAWNTNLSNSVAADRIAVLNSVYPVQSTEAITSITKDDDTKSIVLGITNNTNSPFVIRYMTYKEIE